MELLGDEPLVTVTTENGRVAAVSIRNSWRSSLSVEALGEEIAAQAFQPTATAAAETMAAATTSLRDFRLPTMAELLAESATPTTSHLRRELSIGELAAIQDELTRIAPALLAPRAPSEVKPPDVFAYRGVIEIAHVKDTIYGVTIDKAWAEKATVQTLSERLANAFQDMYAEVDAAPPVPGSSDLPEERSLNQIMAELGLDERNPHA